MAIFTLWLQRRPGKKKVHEADNTSAETADTETAQEHAQPAAMAQTNGIQRESTPVDTSVVPPGRVISTSMMRQGMERMSKWGCKASDSIQQPSNRALHQTLHNGLQPLDTQAQENQVE